jgi:hypothetical protein
MSDIILNLEQTLAIVRQGVRQVIRQTSFNFAFDYGDERLVFKQTYLRQTST